MKLIIQDDEGHQTVVPLVRDEITIGRNDGNVVRLNEKDVSRKHGRLLREGGRFTIEDLGSFTGIRVNGERIHGKRVVGEGDLIEISEYELMLQPEAGQNATGNDLAPDEERALEHAPALETATIRLSDLKPSAVEDVPAEEIPEGQRPRLVGFTGTYRGRELPLHRTPLRVGRSEENDLVVEHPSISRRHLRLHLENGTWKVMDAESRNGVRVNGEPYARIGLRHGDVLEIGHLRFAFVEPGKPFKLPQEFTPVRDPVGPLAPVRRRTPWLLGGSLIAALGLASGAVLLSKHRPAAAGVDADARAARKFAMRAAAEARSGHRYVEALHDLEVARRAGATDAELASFETTAVEARSEELYREMDSAASARDWERARKLLGPLLAAQTYYGAKAAESAEGITAGYVNGHVSAAARLKHLDRAACLAEAQAALVADPKNAEARSLVEACQAPPRRATAARSASPSPRPSISIASIARDDGAARQLVNEGNQKLLAHDVEGAFALFQKALSLQPSGSALGAAYRGLGIAYTRTGNVEEGARYYRLYLPLCTDPGEQAQLQRVLADYDARRR